MSRNDVRIRKSFPDDESGNIAMAAVVAVLLMCVLIGLVGNTGQLTSRKIEAQNAADSAAASSGVWLARGMNTVTAGNHVLGEMMALVVLHEAFGGPALDRGEVQDTSAVDAAIDGAYTGAVASTAVSGAKSPVSSRIVRDRDGVRAEATILDGKRRLKEMAATTYEVHAIGGLLASIPYPPVTAAGRAIAIAAYTIELKITQEYAMLDALESTMRGLVTVKQMVEASLPVGIGLQRQLNEVTLSKVARAACQDVATYSGCHCGELFPQHPRLPLEQQTAEIVPDSAIHLSQLVRASYPWVINWRAPVLKTLDSPLFFLSRAGQSYRRWSQFYSHDKSKRTREEHSVYMFTIRELRPPEEDKGQEPWNEDSQKIDEMFTVVGLAHYTVSRTFSPRLFGKGAEMVTIAQSVVYNANPQEGGSGGRQPEAGWDTLNWKPYDPAVFECDPGNQTGPEPINAPAIQLNWQSKLTPVTRYSAAARGANQYYTAILRKALPYVEPFKTH